MEIIYRAEDGTEFDSEVKCKQHEHRQKNPMALLAVDNDPAVHAMDLIKYTLGKGKCFTLHFEDGSIIEITHVDMCVYNADQTMRLAQYDRRRTEDVSQG